ncbi:forkhead box protein N1 [Ornithorhynchus anatinus]|uniref:forkhead box protein N1 n=1 Tax=Ornithorhynchus anatinus TaxID=9258 RepID=UPI0019D48008|nr:forkhead box protein N1 [Ornithorhynchus anatinus]
MGSHELTGALAPLALPPRVAPRSSAPGPSRPEAAVLQWEAEKSFLGFSVKPSYFSSEALIARPQEQQTRQEATPPRMEISGSLEVQPRISIPTGRPGQFYTALWPGYSRPGGPEEICPAYDIGHNKDWSEDNQSASFQLVHPGCQDWVMVSVLPTPSDTAFSSSEALECASPDGPMQAPGDTGSPTHQSENPGFGCPPYSADSRTERELSDSSHSPSPSSPHQDPLQNRFAPGPGLPNSKAPFHLSPTEKFQSFSYEDGPAGSPNRFLKAGRTPFHPYKRQFPEEVFPEPHQALTLDGRAFKSPAGVEGFEELANPGDTDSFVPGFSSEASWCNGLHYPGQEHGPQIMHGSEVKLKPAAPLEGPPGLYCYQPSVQQMYCPSPPFHHQYSPGASYPVTYLTSSHYPYQRIAPQASPDSQQPLFPKPIYSYSILIFMALKNSKTGSLPVSEIYNFMTEHFPYFKTAPDGWKNSVRHNLSLNKCFEKVENKSGSSSRKGCLWALNPAKIDKMQEELQKWKRKDPVAVRKSMAKPEELDSLIGDKAEKFRPPSLACAGPGLAGPGLPRQMTTAPAALGESAHPSALPQTLHVLHPAPGPLQAKNPLLGGHPPSCYPSAPQGYAHLSPALGQPGGPQTLFPPAEGQGELRAQPSTSQDSPLPAQTPPIHSMKMLTEPSPARTMPDALMPEGDLSNDIDALNPSLTDFDLQGNLWEELKDDSLALDPLVLVSSSPMSSHCFPAHCLMGSHTGGGGGTDLSPQNGGPPGALADVHLTTLYSAFMDLDPVPPAYLNNSSSKPIALV